MQSPFFQFLQHLDEDPDHILFEIQCAGSHATEQISSSRFWESCCRWALKFQKLSDHVIPIFGYMQEQMLAAWIGAILGGKLPVFISYPSTKISRSDYVTKLNHYRQCFGNNVFVGTGSEPIDTGKLIVPGDVASIDHAEFRLCSSTFADPGRMLFLQCSSGSTGLQKAVAVTCGKLDNQLRSYATAIRLDPTSDRVVSWLPLYHDMGLVAGFLLPLVTGTPVIYIDTFEWALNPSILLSAVETTKSTLCWLPNFAFSFLCKAKPQFDLSSVRSFINCSEMVSWNAMDNFIKHHRVNASQLSISYALAENVFAVSQSEVTEAPAALVLDRKELGENRVKIEAKCSIDGKSTTQANHFGPESVAVFDCGEVIPGCEVKIDAHQGDDIGKILIRGASCIHNYYNQHSASADGWLATGDLGFLHGDHIFVTGRATDVIVYRGKNIYPYDVETIINEVDGVHRGRSVVLGFRDDSDETDQIVVLVELTKSLRMDERASLSRRIANRVKALFDVQCRVDLVPRMWLKKTSSGKIARTANLDQWLASRRRVIHIVGDSHVLLLTHGPGLGDRFKEIKTHWVGPAVGAKWRELTPKLVRSFSNLSTDDYIVIMAGEPECRSIFPGADDPDAAINAVVAQYRQLIRYLTQIAPGRVAFMTGIPTNPTKDVHHQRDGWSFLGTPELTYQLQDRFYSLMRVMCEEEFADYIDLITRLREANGFLDPAKMADLWHLDPRHLNVYIESLEELFGFVSLTTSEPELERIEWDGSFSLWREIVQRFLLSREYVSNAAELTPDSIETLDSLAAVDLIETLQRRCGIEIPLHELTREDISDIDRLWNKFFAGKLL